MCDVSNWLASGAALVSAIMAYASFAGAEESRKLSIAVSLSPHFHNVKDVIYYLKNWSGFSQDILNQKRESISVLRSFLSNDAELNAILNKIDPWPNKQTVLDEEEKQLDVIMKKYLRMDK